MLTNRKALVLCLLFIGACASQARVTSTTFAALNTARDGFVAWDLQHQEELAATTPSADAKKATLAEYRGKRAKVAAAFVVAYAAVTAASIDGSQTTVNAALDAVKAVVTAMAGLGAL